jgi:hypothetical protein
MNRIGVHKLPLLKFPHAKLHLAAWVGAGGFLKSEEYRDLVNLEEPLHQGEGVVGGQQKRQVQLEQAEARALSNDEAVRIVGAAQEDVVGLVEVVLPVEVVRTRAVKNINQLIVRVPRLSASLLRRPL